MLVSTGWVSDNLDKNHVDVRLVDCTGAIRPSSIRSIANALQARIRSPSWKPEGFFRYADARRQHERRHIPHSYFLDVTHMTAAPEKCSWKQAQNSDILEALAQVVGPFDAETHIVLYAQTQVAPECGIMWCTRIWWTLRGAGVQGVSIMDGGLQKWIAEGRPVARGPARALTAAAADYEYSRAVAPVDESSEPSGMTADRDDVLSALTSSGPLVINALPALARWLVFGMIAGSSSPPFVSCLSSDGCFKSKAELARFFQQRGREAVLDPSTKVICYCGGGICATTVAFGLALAGKNCNVAVYDGSTIDCLNADNPLHARLRGGWPAVAKFSVSVLVAALAAASAFGFARL